MIVYRFLDDGGHDPFLPLRWPLPEGGTPGPWVDARRLPQASIEAYRWDQLAHWMGTALWEVEVQEPVEDVGGLAVSAVGARLVRQVTAWSTTTLAHFATACAWRTRDTAVRALRHAGQPEAAGSLQACKVLPAVAGAAAAIVGVAAPLRVMARFAAEAAGFAAGPDHLRQAVPFVAAHAAGREQGPPGTTPFAAGFMAEKEWQAHWLAHRLALPSGT